MTGLHVTLAALLLLPVLGCGADGGTPGPSAPASATDSPAAGSGPWFVERGAAAGLDFRHETGRSGRFYQPEIMGPGVGLFDYDGDGDLDVYLVQGRPLGAAAAARGDASDLRGRLYRNDLDPGAGGPGGGTPAFTDVTARSGLDSRRYGMGVAVGDVTNDGCLDLYLTHLGPNQLYVNNCDGTFSDRSDESGTADPGWGVSAAFADIDRDGWLDLFVGNYLEYEIERHVRCESESGMLDYCPPDRYRPQPDRLYRNLGDGRFDDVTVDAGLGAAYGPALGVATADFDGDGWIDLFVANDQRENQLWRNVQHARFDEVALVSGVALGGSGDRKADMGVDAGDFDNDGDEDLIVTELTGQGSTLYVNRGAGVFEDRSGTTGIRAASFPYTGFGTAWLDVDNDGWLDIAAVNGFVTQDLEALGPDNPFPLQQSNVLFRNLDGERFEDVTERAGAAFVRAEVSRGAAFGDIDNDGDTDIIVANAGGPARLLVNEVGHRRHWLGLRLVGGDPPRDMPGARVEVVRADGTTLWRRARTDGSYASANDPRVLVGLGDRAGAPTVRVTWPSGHREEWTDVPTDRYTVLVEGTGR